MKNQLFQFLKQSPTAFHAVNTMKESLKKAGAQELLECNPWELKEDQMYYVTRNDSALIAFSVPKCPKGFRIMASHSDSPTYKIKENPEMVVEDKYIKLNVEKYGGMIHSTWLDRPLSVAGRVIVKENDKFVTKLVDINRDLLVIPNLAIHMSRNVNDGYAFHVQKDMLPLFGGIEAKGRFMKMIAESAGVSEKDILGHDLFLYLRQDGFSWGADNEFFSAPRIDDLECAFSSLNGFINGEKKKYCAVHCVFDNEEVGSMTKQGAAATFLLDTLKRISVSFGYSEEKYLQMISESLMVSADNGHALHPNHGEVCDPTNRPCMNKGIMIKYSANQRYCTDGVSAAMFRDLCNEAGAETQVFVNHSDMMGGSTLGNISTTHVALNTVDIGLPQLAMHSCLETAGAKDLDDLVNVAQKLFA